MQNEDKELYKECYKHDRDLDITPLGNYNDKIVSSLHLINTLNWLLHENNFKIDYTMETLTKGYHERFYDKDDDISFAYDIFVRKKIHQQNKYVNILMKNIEKIENMNESCYVYKDAPPCSINDLINQELLNDDDEIVTAAKYLRAIDIDIKNLRDYLTIKESNINKTLESIEKKEFAKIVVPKNDRIYNFKPKSLNDVASVIACHVLDVRYPKTQEQLNLIGQQLFYQTWETTRISLQNLIKLLTEKKFDYISIFDYGCRSCSGGVYDNADTIYKTELLNGNIVKEKFNELALGGRILKKTRKNELLRKKKHIKKKTNTRKKKHIKKKTNTIKKKHIKKKRKTKSIL
jgi:hypothetical protein